MSITIPTFKTSPNNGSVLQEHRKEFIICFLVRLLLHLLIMLLEEQEKGCRQMESNACGSGWSSGNIPRKFDKVVTHVYIKQAS